MLPFVILFILVQQNNVIGSSVGSKDFKFITYNLTIIPNFQNSIFDGLLWLEVTPERNVSEIVLSKGNYSVDVEISGVNRVDLNVNQENEILKLKLNKSLTEGKEYVITMSFKNLKIRDDMTGFYKTQISKSEWAYLTNFYPNHARKVFPCIDDPTIRSTFILNVNLTSESYNQVLSNSEKRAAINKIVTFQDIANLSVHNFAFAILNNFTESNEEIRERIHFHMRSDIDNKFAIFAINKFPIIIDDLASAFADYYPLNKLDVIAVPDYVPQENSNLGLVMLPESFLLYHESSPSFREMLKIERSITRACASMWLQNIITPKTWEQAWVGESLVKYYEYFGFGISNDIRDEADLFVIDIHQKTMLEESLGWGGKNIRVDRAASIFRMLETFVGIENFTKSIRMYMRSNQNQSTSIDDLLKEFDDHIILSNWLQNTGYPILNVNFITNSTIVLSAKTFSLNPSNSIQGQSWTIPFELVDIYSDSNMRSQVLLSDSTTALINGTETFTIMSRENISGYYRVNYDLETWNKIVRILNSEFHKKISAIDKSAILDDMFNLARAGSLDYEILLKGLKYLKSETEYLPLKTAINGLKYLLQVYESNKTDEHYKILLNWTRDIFGSIFSTLPMEENLLIASEIIDFACFINDPICVLKVTTLLDRFIDKNKGIPGDFRSAVYCNALKLEDQDLDKKHYFDKMLDKLKQVTLSSEKLDILMGLGCYHNFEKLEWFLNESMSSFEKFEIYKAELVKVMESIYSSSLEKSELMLSFLKDHYKQFEFYFDGMEEIMDMVSKMSRMHQSKNMIKVLSDFESVIGAKNNLFMQEVIEKMSKQMQASNMIVQKLAKVLEDPNIISTTTTTELTTTTEPTTTPASAPKPASIGITLLKVVSGLAFFVIILLFGYFIFNKYFKTPYNSVTNRNGSDDGSVVVIYDNTVV